MRRRNLAALCAPLGRAASKGLVFCAGSLFVGHVVGFLSDAIAATVLPAELVEQNSKPSMVKAGLGLCDSPTVDAEGNLYFLDRTSSAIWSLPTTGAIKQLSLKIEKARAIAVERDGSFLVGKPKELDKVALDGAESLVVGGDILGDPEDFSVGASGALFFSNGSGKAVYYRTPEGKRIAQRGAVGVISGLAYYDEKQQLYASLREENKVSVYDISTEGFISQNRKDVAKVAEPGGITLDGQGNLYVVSGKDKAIVILGKDGKEIGRFDLSSDKSSALPAPTNVIFAGADRKTLFITGDGGLWKLQMKVAGLSR